MKHSNYQDFMECMKRWETVGRALACGFVLWEKLKECEALGISIQDIDLDAATQEIEDYFSAMQAKIYDIALQEWAKE